jgi:protein O-GlcNAc transferase
MKRALLLLLLPPFFLLSAAQENTKPDQGVSQADWKKQNEERIQLYKSAIEAAERDVSSNPKSPEAHFRLAEIYVNGPLDDATQKKAVEQYLKAIRLKPDFAEAYLGLAHAYSNLSKYSAAYEALHKAISLRPDYAEAYCRLGFTYLNPDKYENGPKLPVTEEDIKHAEEALEKAVKIKPEYYEAQVGLGMVYELLGKKEEALKTYGQAVILNPDDHLIHFRLGNIYVEFGNKEAATQEYEKLKYIADEASKQKKAMGLSDEPNLVRGYANDLLKKIKGRFEEK